MELPENDDQCIHHFLTALALCNSSFIIGENQDTVHQLDFQPKYEGDNADDLVLCQAASDFGVRMISRTARTIVVRYFSRDQSRKVDVEYEILCLIPFDSNRRRMSIVVRVDQKIYLYIKGAESMIMSSLIESDEEQRRIRTVTERHNLEFSDQGFRSLMVAYRPVDLQQYEIWSELYHEAANSLSNREEAIANVANQLEQNLYLLGLTAVEDKLQQGVPKTIAALRCAEIKIWLLTGDKQATALSTAQAASLINVTSNNTTNTNVNKTSERNQISFCLLLSILSNLYRICSFF